MSRTRVGEIRPSQLLWTYGPGALIDLPNMSVITQGIDKWDTSHCEPILESRLLSAVKKGLGPQIENLNKPPMTDEEATSPLSAAALVGVPVKPFPRWLRCVRCGLLSPFDSGLFTLKKSPYRPEATRFVHAQCRGSGGNLKPKDADAVPARFLLACQGRPSRRFSLAMVRPWWKDQLYWSLDLLRKWRVASDGKPLGQMQHVWGCQEHGPGVRSFGSREPAGMPRAASSPRSVRRRL